MSAHETATLEQLKQQVIDDWNALASREDVQLPRVLRVSGKADVILTARVKDTWWMEHYKQALALIPESDYLLGKIETWRANFKLWFIRPDSVARILEGMYANRTPRPNTQQAQYLERDRQMREQADRDAAENVRADAIIDSWGHDHLLMTLDRVLYRDGIDRRIQLQRIGYKAENWRALGLSALALLRQEALKSQ